MDNKAVEILVVEDEEKIAKLISDYLINAGYQVSIVTDGGIAVERFREINPALVLLDIMLPNKSGTDICRELRQFTEVPIIMVSARVEEIDRVLGLELGANDYVCKPFSPRELVARVKANLRFYHSNASLAVVAQPAAAEQTGGVFIDEAKHSAHLDGHPLTLTPVEYRILVALTKKPGHVWSRDKLLNTMYDDHRTVSDRTVDSHMANLRRKLQQIRPNIEAVRSIYGVGYRLEL